MHTLTTSAADIAAAEVEATTPRMRRVRVDELRPSHVPIAWHAANGVGLSEIASRLHLSRLTIESALRDIRAHLGVTRTTDVRLFHAEIKTRFDAVAASAAATADEPGLLTPAEVARLFRVDPKTVTRWAASGKISAIKTPGGHRRFREAEVRALLDPAVDDEDGE